MENIKSENSKAVSISFDVLDIAKTEAFIKGKTTKTRRFGYMVESPMQFNDFVRGLLIQAIANVPETAAVKKRAAELRESQKKHNKPYLEKAIQKEQRKVMIKRDAHKAKCVTSVDLESHGKPLCYDPKNKTIVLGRRNDADKVVHVKVNEDSSKGRRYLLVPMTAEWRDRLLTVRNGKVAGHADKVCVRLTNGDERVWKVRDIRAGNVTFSFRAFSDKGEVPSKGIIPKYFAVLFTGRCKAQFPDAKE